MTQDEIIEMAKQAGLHIATDVKWMPIIGLEYAEKFAKLVREDALAQPMHPEIKKMYEDYFDKCFRESSAPPQRKPLTLGQKQRLWSSVGDKPTLKDRVNAYGLAIEAAHSIKENT